MEPIRGSSDVWWRDEDSSIRRERRGESCSVYPKTSPAACKRPKYLGLLLDAQHTMRPGTWITPRRKKECRGTDRPRVVVLPFVSSDLSPWKPAAWSIACTVDIFVPCCRERSEIPPRNYLHRTLDARPERLLFTPPMHLHTHQRHRWCRRLFLLSRKLLSIGPDAMAPPTPPLYLHLPDGSWRSGSWSMSTTNYSSTLSYSLNVL